PEGTAKRVRCRPRIAARVEGTTADPVPRSRHRLPVGSGTTDDLLVANPWDIANFLEVEEDVGHPDGRHTFKAVVADLSWDEDPKPGRPEMTGQWLLAHADGSQETIDVPRSKVDRAVAEARKRVATRLAHENDEG